MNKRKLHHLWTKVRWIKPWYFLVLAIISGVICVFALRSNNHQMIELRDAVYAADQNESDVQAPLRTLQAYVTSHMNTNLNAGKSPVYPPIQLKYTYERLVQAKQEEFARSNNQLYTEAQAQGENANPNVTLVKLGCELHEPFDKMVINRDQVTFWENLQDSGQVAEAVKTFKQQNPNGQKCADQSTSSSTNSTNATQNAAPNNGGATNTNTNP